MTLNSAPRSGAADEATVRVEPAAGPLRGVGYDGLVELGPSRAASQVAHAAEVYGDLSVDSVLKGFRERAGLPAPGLGLEGWARETSEMTFGQWISGLARLSTVLRE